MIGFYQTRDEKGLNSTFVLGSFLVCQKNEKVITQYQPDFLENLSTEFIADSNMGEIQKDINRRIYVKIKVKDNFLRHINNLVKGKKYSRLDEELISFHKKISGLLETCQ